MALSAVWEGDVRRGGDYVRPAQPIAQPIALPGEA